MSFDQLGLSSPLLQAVAKEGYDTPSPIQEQAIPAILKGQDVMAAAQTGTGKTAGFTLPLLERLSSGDRPTRNQVRSLVLTPTRELAAQVKDSVVKYSHYTPLRSVVAYGGVNINPQMLKLRRGTDVLVATPGRLLDLYTKNAIKFDQLETLVLDEADRMLDMGFINDIKKIIALLPARRQNLMFSATFSPAIRKLAQGLVNDPVEIAVTPENTTAETVEQTVIPVDKSKKPALLVELIQSKGWFQVLVFCRTKHGANRLAYQLEKAKIQAAAIHGNKSQGARTRALAAFKQGEIHVLVATDIAARGLDIDQLPQVVNFDLPHVAEDYVHRIGRTGRAGAKGQAFSLVCADEAKELFAIERLIQQIIPRRGVPGFTPKEKLVDSPTKLKPVKPKRPKKPKKAKAEHADGPRSDKASAKKSHSRSGAANENSNDSAKKIDNKRPEKKKSSNKKPTNKKSNETAWSPYGSKPKQNQSKAQANKPSRKKSPSSQQAEGSSQAKGHSKAEGSSTKGQPKAKIRQPRKRPLSKD